MKKAFRYIIISILSIILTLVVVCVLFVAIDTKSSVDVEVEEGQIYSSEEVEALVDEAKEEGRVSVLDSLRESLENGNTIISVLKSFYPEYIVVAANQKYNFVPINEELTKSAFNIDNLVEELEHHIFDLRIVFQVKSFRQSQV